MVRLLNPTPPQTVMSHLLDSLCFNPLGTNVWNRMNHRVCTGYRVLYEQTVSPTNICLTV